MTEMDTFIENEGIYPQKPIFRFLQYELDCIADPSLPLPEDMSLGIFLNIRSIAKIIENYRRKGEQTTIIVGEELRILSPDGPPLFVEPEI